MPLALAEAYLNQRDKAFFQTFHFATNDAVRCSRGLLKPAGQGLLPDSFLPMMPLASAEAYTNLRDSAFFQTFYFATDDVVGCSRNLLKPAGQCLFLDILPPTMLLL